MVKLPNVEAEALLMLTIIQNMYYDKTTKQSSDFL